MVAVPAVRYDDHDTSYVRVSPTEKGTGSSFRGAVPERWAAWPVLTHTIATSAAHATAFRTLREYNPALHARRHRGDDAVERTARRRVRLSRNPSGAERQAAGLDAEPHRARHRDRILRQRDRRIHEHGVRAELHGEGRIRRGAHSGVDDHRHARLLPDDADVVRVLDAEARSNWRAEGHHRGCARVFQLAAHHGVV